MGSKTYLKSWKVLDFYCFKKSLFWGNFVKVSLCLGINFLCVIVIKLINFIYPNSKIIFELSLLFDSDRHKLHIMYT